MSSPNSEQENAIEPVITQNNQRAIVTQKKEQSQQDTKHVTEGDSVKIVRQRPPVKEPKKKKKVHLSFEDELENIPREKIQKNPVFKQQKQQGEVENNVISLEEKLRAEFLEKTEKISQDYIEFEYAHWDSVSVIHKLRRKKREKIIDLLQICRLELISARHSLVKVPAAQLVFVIKDFIVPHQMTFAEIQTLGLKTNNDEDLLNLKELRIKKDGKELNLSVNVNRPVRIIEKERYEKSKAIYPFTKWETLKVKI